MFSTTGAKVFSRLRMFHELLAGNSLFLLQVVSNFMQQAVLFKRLECAGGPLQLNARLTSQHRSLQLLPQSR